MLRGCFLFGFEAGLPYFPVISFFTINFCDRFSCLYILWSNYQTNMGYCYKKLLPTGLKCNKIIDSNSGSRFKDLEAEDIWQSSKMVIHADNARKIIEGMDGKGQISARYRLFFGQPRTKEDRKINNAQSRYNDEFRLCRWYKITGIPSWLSAALIQIE